MDLNNQQNFNDRSNMLRIVDFKNKNKNEHSDKWIAQNLNWLNETFESFKIKSKWNVTPLLGHFEWRVGICGIL